MTTRTLRSGVHRIVLLLVLLPLLTGGLVAVVGCGTKKVEPEEAADLTTTEKARLAESFFKVGRIQDALNSLSEAIDEDPTNVSLHHFYGFICFRSGRYEEAEAAFHEALRLDSGFTDSRNMLGAVYDQTGRKNEAEMEWKRALQDPVYPNPEKIYFNLGVLYTSQGRDVEAVDMLRRSVEIDPRYYQAHYELASLLGRTGRLGEAAREFEVAAPAFRNDGEYFYRLGMTYLRLEEKDKARDSLTRVLHVAPGSPSAAQASELLEMLD